MHLWNNKHGCELTKREAIIFPSIYKLSSKTGVDYYLRIQGEFQEANYLTLTKHKNKVKSQTCINGSINGIPHQSDSFKRVSLRYTPATFKGKEKWTIKQKMSKSPTEPQF